MNELTSPPASQDNLLFLQQFFAHPLARQLTFVQANGDAFKYTANDIRQHALACYGWFGRQRHIAPGDKIAVLADVSCVYLATLLGAWHYGLTVVLIESTSNAVIIQQQLLDSNCKLLACTLSQAKQLQNLLLDTLVREIIVYDFHGGIANLTTTAKTPWRPVIKGYWQRLLSKGLYINNTHFRELLQSRRIAPSQAKLLDRPEALIVYGQVHSDGMGLGVVYSLGQLLTYVRHLVHSRNHHPTQAICAVQSNLYGLSTLLGHLLLGDSTHIIVLGPQPSAANLAWLPKYLTATPCALFANVQFYQSLLAQPTLAALPPHIVYCEGSHILANSELVQWQKQYQQPYYSGHAHHAAVHFYSYGKQHSPGTPSFTLLGDISCKFVPHYQSNEAYNPSTEGQLFIASAHFATHYWQHPGATIAMYTPDNYLNSPVPILYGHYTQLVSHAKNPNNASI